MDKSFLRLDKNLRNAILGFWATIYFVKTLVRGQFGGCFPMTIDGRLESPRLDADFRRYAHILFFTQLKLQGKYYNGFTNIVFIVTEGWQLVAVKLTLQIQMKWSKAYCTVQNVSRKSTLVFCKYAWTNQALSRWVFPHEISLTLLKYSIKITQQGQYKKDKKHFNRFKF